MCLQMENENELLHALKAQELNFSSGKIKKTLWTNRPIESAVCLLELSCAPS